MTTLNTQQHFKEDLLIPSRYFTFFISSLSSLLSLSKLSYTKKHLIFNLYRILYTLNFCYKIYYIVLEICTGERFLEECFYYYFQQIISAVVNVFLIPYKLMKKATETQNFWYGNTQCQPKPNQKNFLEQEILFHTNKNKSAHK